jgi:hypothetical protein
MPNFSLRRKVVTFLFVLAFTASGASATGPRALQDRPTSVAVPTLVELAGRFLGFLTNVWVRTGCNIDPSGLCANSTELPPPADGADEGCHIDPDGRCISVPTVLSAGQREEGCHIDPSGYCFP